MRAPDLNPHEEQLSVHQETSCRRAGSNQQVMGEGRVAGRTMKAVLASALGYALVVVSAFVISATIEIMTGYYPSLHFFTLALITFRLIEIAQAFLIVPPLIAMFATILLSRIPIDTRIAGGLGLASYYILVGLIFAAIGGGDFPYEIMIIWVALVFFFGFLSATAIDIFERLLGSRERKSQSKI